MPKLRIDIDAPCYDDYLSYLDAVLVLEYNNKNYEILVFDLEDKEEVKHGKEFLKSLGFSKTDEFDWEDEIIEISDFQAQELLKIYEENKRNESTILQAGPDYVIPIYREEITSINPDGSITITTKVNTIPISPG